MPRLSILDRYVLREFLTSTLAAVVVLLVIFTGSTFASLVNQVASGLTHREIAEALNMLAEATTTELTQIANPQGLEENKKIAQEGGSIAGDTRKAIESKTGQPVITPKNAISFSQLIEEVAKERSK